MPSSELTISLSSWAMRLEQARAEAASRNIAQANQPGVKAVKINFADQLNNMRLLATNQNIEAVDIRHLQRQEFGMQTHPTKSIAGGISLDAEVADLSTAELRYKTLAEALTRQFSLISLAASGKQ